MAKIPLWRPLNPKKGVQKGVPKWTPKWVQKWPKMAKMAQNGPKWPKIGPKTGVLAENGHFWGFWHLGPRGPQNAPKSVINMAQEAKMAKKGHFGPSLAWDPGFRGFDPYFRGWPKRHAETTGNGQKGVKIGSKYGPK